MKSRPQFEVKLTKGTQTTRFACAFVQDGGDLPEDEGPSKYFIDLLMNLLEERGVSNDFASKMSELATKREHDLFVNLLEKLQSFVQGK